MKDERALLVIDAIEAISEDSVYDPESADGLYRVNLAKAVEAAHNAGLPVIFANDAHIRGVDQELELWGEHGMKGETRILPEIEQRDNDFVIEKRRYSAFFATDLDLLLKELGVTEIVAVGADTNICVLHSLADAYFLNYKTTVIEDATLTFLGVGTQEFGIEHCVKCYGTKVITLDDFVTSLA